MTEHEDIRASVARLIRQSREMGEEEWFLDGMDRRTALEHLRPRPSDVPALPDAPAADLHALRERLARPVEPGGVGRRCQ